MKIYMEKLSQMIAVCSKLTRNHASGASRTAEISYFKVQPLSQLETARTALRCHFARRHYCGIRRKKTMSTPLVISSPSWLIHRIFSLRRMISLHPTTEWSSTSGPTQTNLHHFTHTARGTLDQAPESHNQPCSYHGNPAAKCPAPTPHSSYTS